MHLPEANLAIIVFVLRLLLNRQVLLCTLGALRNEHFLALNQLRYVFYSRVQKIDVRLLALQRNHDVRLRPHANFVCLLIKHRVALIKLYQPGNVGRQPRCQARVNRARHAHRVLEVAPSRVLIGHKYVLPIHSFSQKDLAEVDAVCLDGEAASRGADEHFVVAQCRLLELWVSLDWMLVRSILLLRICGSGGFCDSLSGRCVADSQHGKRGQEELVHF